MIRIKDLSHTFATSERSHLALDRVSAAVQRGRFVSLIGASGCGKTTLLRILAGLLRQSEGTVTVDGRMPELGREDVAYVFQQDALWPWRTIEGAVSFPLEMRGFSKNFRSEKAKEALKLVGLAGYERAYPHQLSGGMRQRVNICRALVSEPALLLMDEPFGALDAQTREYLQGQLARIVNETDLTVVFVTHDISEAIYLSDEVIVLSSSPGRVKEVVSVPGYRSDRDLSFKRSPEFQAYTEHVWTLIADDVRSAMVDTSLTERSSES
ncbi:ABC transporter ATP-binding protein [Microbacterium pseudoresistens]|uniref:NitT/TauT family transport system ATP-binding protein n=1 Tax=Microbacterium pseudoresistens TaxID=640634 RepID=A0A7Y9EW32_9MICO|nr:ABC transporter ATP-binding protein [Microbacterium pseudoresistens]NYD54889.1 NitT/TauT family transport system ATP-binding protein [Microbacterium pseudoresistens]